MVSSRMDAETAAVPHAESASAMELWKWRMDVPFELRQFVKWAAHSISSAAFSFSHVSLSTRRDTSEGGYTGSP